MQFQIYIDNEIIGYSQLEWGDAPMGAAGGIFHPTEAYLKYQQIFINSDFEKIYKLNLYAVAEDGLKFEPVGGVSIIDCSVEIGSEGIEVDVVGLDCKIYQKYFPQHIEAYENKFKL